MINIKGCSQLFSLCTVAKTCVISIMKYRYRNGPNNEHFTSFVQFKKGTYCVKKWKYYDKRL